MTSGSPSASPGRVVLLVTSPRTAPGLLTWPAWQLLRQADAVLAADLDPAWLDAMADAGVTVDDVAALPVAQRAGRLLEATAQGSTAVWFGSPDADPGLTDALAEHLARRAVTGAPPEVELLGGSSDLPGARLLDLVAVMDRLRSPGGCPWDARQTHASLLPYLLEETHEVFDAVESGDVDHLREELGDLLLQVAFHARVAEDGAQPFGIDDVAAGIVAKLVHRHPHVFADGEARTADELASSWEDLKAAEKQRTTPFEGIPRSLPALALAQKMLARLDRAPSVPDGTPDVVLRAAVAGDGVADALLATVRKAAEQGVDAESALRSALYRLAAMVEGRG